MHSLHNFFFVCSFRIITKIPRSSKCHKLILHRKFKWWTTNSFPFCLLLFHFRHAIYQLFLLRNSIKKKKMENAERKFQMHIFHFLNIARIVYFLTSQLFLHSNSTKYRKACALYLKYLRKFWKHVFLFLEYNEICLIDAIYCNAITEPSCVEW